jgi:hypothetical protein
VGIRALPPLRQVVGEQQPGPWCYNIPLWGTPVLGHREQWEWFGQQRQVLVGLEFALPDLCGLPHLQCVGDGVRWLKLLEDICAASGDPGAQAEAYRMHVLGPLVQGRARYADMHVALADLRLLVAAIPQAWQEAARQVLQAQPPLRLPVVTPAMVDAARARVCSGLGWITREGEVVELQSLTVALATRCQSLDALAAIAERHRSFVTTIQQFDALQPAPGPLPLVPKVLHRWWKVRVPNTFKEAAWRLTLNAFPTAARMHTGTCCVACGAQEPGVGHHCWECPVAVAVRREVEGQLRAHVVEGAAFLAAGGRLSCASLWLGVKPHHRLHRLVWDLVCLAFVHAVDFGRRAAWSVSKTERGAALPLLAVEGIASRAAVGEFWSVLADFAVSAVVPGRLQNVLLTKQPFLAWHAVLMRGSRLRVVRH